MHDSTRNQQIRNAETVARGGGSPQARACDDGSCDYCNGNHDTDEHRESANHCANYIEPDGCKVTLDGLCDHYETCSDWEENS